MKNQIKKSELRKLVKEHLSSFMPGVAPLGAMGNATLQDSLDRAAGVEVNKEEFDAILSKVVSQIEKNASIRMTAESVGVKDKSSLNEAKSIIPQLEKIVQDKQHAKIKGKIVDLFTASMIMKIYNAVNDSNKKRMDNLPLEKLVNLAYKMMKRESTDESTKEAITEVSGTDSMKPNDPTEKDNEEEKDAADDVMEGLIPEGKKAKLTDKVLDDPSTIKLVNPSNRKETFVIFSRNIKGMRGKQDKFSMVTIDKNGMIIDDYGAHKVDYGAIKFAKSRGFTKQIK